jgi:hypothetical protein
MSNATWVCFECHQAVRRSTVHVEAVRCPQCDRACICLGTKIRIPPKSDSRAWRTLRDSIREGRVAAGESNNRLRAIHRHRLERQIAHLEAGPLDPKRQQLLDELRSKLAAM